MPSRVKQALPQGSLTQSSVPICRVNPEFRENRGELCAVFHYIPTPEPVTARKEKSHRALAGLNPENVHGTRNPARFPTTTLTSWQPFPTRGISGLQLAINPEITQRFHGGKGVIPIQSLIDDCIRYTRRRFFGTESQSRSTILTTHQLPRFSFKI